LLLHGRTGLGGWPGLDAPLPVELAVIEELGFSDPAITWVVANVNAIGYVASRLDEARARQLLADGAYPYAFGLALVGRTDAQPEGWFVSGDSPVVRGCQDAGWFPMARKMHRGDVLQTTNGLPQVRFAVLPAAACTMSDTWSDVVAVRGSGSHAVRVTGAPVDGALLVNLTAPPRLPVERDRVPQLLNACLALPATVMGIAGAAVAAVIGQASGRVSLVSCAAWRN
jgi:hypothetical protein